MTPLVAAAQLKPGGATPQYNHCGVRYGMMTTADSGGSILAEGNSALFCSARRSRANQVKANQDMFSRVLSASNVLRAVAVLLGLMIGQATLMALGRSGVGDFVATFLLGTATLAALLWLSHRTSNSKDDKQENPAEP